MTSCYFSSKISWVSTLFLDTDGYLPFRTAGKKSHTCQFFLFFCNICRTTFCWDRGSLLPRQRDVMTSLYFSMYFHKTFLTMYIFARATKDWARFLERWLSLTQDKIKIKARFSFLRTCKWNLKYTVEPLLWDTVMMTQSVTTKQKRNQILILD